MYIYICICICITFKIHAQITVNSAGTGYVQGTIQVVGGCDAAAGCVYAFAKFTVDASGAITAIMMTDHGAGYQRDPDAG